MKEEGKHDQRKQKNKRRKTRENEAKERRKKTGGGETKEFLQIGEKKKENKWRINKTKRKMEENGRKAKESTKRNTCRKKRYKE